MRLALILTLTLISCGTKKPPEAVPADEDAASTAPPLTMATMLSTMHGNLATFHDAHAAVIRGDLEATAAAAAKLERIPKVDGFPEPWIDKQMDLQMAAGHARRAETIDQAASRVVAMGQRCADCHTFVGDGPKFYIAPEPATNGELDAHMKHHVWAVDLMWKGIIAPDTALFQKGAAGLAEGSARPAGDGRVSEITSVEQIVHAEAKAASALTDRAEQAKAYSVILGTCATCHRAANVEPELSFNPTVER
jgi:cytochrome c553